MAECEHYEFETQSMPSREFPRDRQRRPPSFARIPWCAHPKHSPVEHKMATSALGGGQLLQCAGQFAKCPLTDDQFDDV